MRGEKLFKISLCIFYTGSPPHARGKVHFMKICIRKLRITPACAGKSMGLFNQFPFTKDHPRMRGEKSTMKKAL